MQNLPGWLRHGYVLLAVILSFVIFNAGSMTQAGYDLAAMFCIAGLPLSSQAGFYYLRSYGPVLILSIIGATPLPKRLLRQVPGRITAVLQPVALGLLVLICTAYLVDGSFNPFLYFRF
jgi:alginate O-acetyltransferase complex protein AlgI